MDQENENREGAFTEKPVENDLFTISDGQAVPQETAGEVPPASEPSAEETAKPEPVKEPEFRINENEIPPVRTFSENNSSEQGNVPEKENSVVVLPPGSGPSLGTLLTEARTMAGLSVGDAAAATRIRADYIEALEQNRPDALPNQVFLRAYVHALIQIYNLDPNSVAMIENQLKEVQPASEVPKKLLEDISKDGQINETETKKLKMFLVYGVIILVLLVSLIVTSIVSIRIRNARREARQEKQTEQPFDSAKLEHLLPPQLPNPQMLQVPSESAPASDESKK